MTRDRRKPGAAQSGATATDMTQRHATDALPTPAAVSDQTARANARGAPDDGAIPCVDPAPGAILAMDPAAGAVPPPDLPAAAMPPSGQFVGNTPARGQTARTVIPLDQAAPLLTVEHLRKHYPFTKGVLRRR